MNWTELTVRTTKNTLYWGKRFSKSNKVKKGACRQRIGQGRQAGQEYILPTRQTGLQTKDNKKTGTIYRGGNRCTTLDTNETRVAEGRCREWNNQGDRGDTEQGLTLADKIVFIAFWQSGNHTAVFMFHICALKVGWVSNKFHIWRLQSPELLVHTF